MLGVELADGAVVGDVELPGRYAYGWAFWGFVRARIQWGEMSGRVYHIRRGALAA